MCANLYSLNSVGQVYRPSHQGLRLSRRPATFSLREEVSWMFCPMCIGSSQRPKAMFGCTKANPLEHWIKLLWKHLLERYMQRIRASRALPSLQWLWLARPAHTRKWLRKSNQAQAEILSKQSTNNPKTVHQGKSTENPRKLKDHLLDVF